MNFFFIIKESTDNPSDTPIVEDIFKKFLTISNQVQKITISEISKIKETFKDDFLSHKLHFIFPITHSTTLSMLDKYLFQNESYKSKLVCKTILLLPQQGVIDYLQLLSSSYFDAIIYSSISIEEIMTFEKKMIENKKYIQQKNRESINFEKINDAMTEQERKIFALLREGKQNKEIADILFISPNTVKNHKANLIKKLNLKNNIQLQFLAFDSLPLNK